MAKKKPYSPTIKRWTYFCRDCEYKEEGEAPSSRCAKCGSPKITLNDHRWLYSFVLPLDKDRFNAHLIERLHRVP